MNQKANKCFIFCCITQQLSNHNCQYLGSKHCTTEDYRKINLNELWRSYDVMLEKHPFMMKVDMPGKGDCAACAAYQSMFNNRNHFSTADNASLQKQKNSICDLLAKKLFNTYESIKHDGRVHKWRNHTIGEILPQKLWMLDNHIALTAAYLKKTIIVFCPQFYESENYAKGFLCYGNNNYAVKRYALGCDDENNKFYYYSRSKCNEVDANDLILNHNAIAIVHNGIDHYEAIINNMLPQREFEWPELVSYDMCSDNENLDECPICNKTAKKEDNAVQCVLCEKKMHHNMNNCNCVKEHESLSAKWEKNFYCSRCVNKFCEFFKIGGDTKNLNQMKCCFQSLNLKQCDIADENKDIIDHLLRGLMQCAC